MVPGLCRDPASLETSLVVLASPSLWILYSRVTDWHALLFTNNYQISPPENRPTKNLLLLRLDALLIPILADRPGLSVDLCFSLVAMALFGLPLLCEGTLKGWSGKLFGGREKNPEHTGSPCTA